MSGGNPEFKLALSRRIHMICTIVQLPIPRNFWNKSMNLKGFNENKCKWFLEMMKCLDSLL